jgi:hypothetical protein
MFTLVVVSFLVVQALAVLLLIGGCVIAATTDRKSVRPYVPQPVELRPIHARAVIDRSAMRVQQTA